MYLLSIMVFKKRLHKHLKNQNTCKSTCFVFQNVHLMFDFAIQGVVHVYYCKVQKFLCVG
jgi:hypothetical protein